MIRRRVKRRQAQVFSIMLSVRQTERRCVMFLGFLSLRSYKSRTIRKHCFISGNSEPSTLIGNESSRCVRFVRKKSRRHNHGIVDLHIIHSNWSEHKAQRSWCDQCRFSLSPCTIQYTNSMAYGTRRFIAAFTRALQQSLSSAESTQFLVLLGLHISLKSILILSSHLRLELSKGLIPVDLPVTIQYTDTLNKYAQNNPYPEPNQPNSPLWYLSLQSPF